MLFGHKILRSVNHCLDNSSHSQKYLLNPEVVLFCLSVKVLLTFL